MDAELLEPQTAAAPTATSPRETVMGERYGVVGRTNPELLESMFGCFADDPAFERVVKFMEDERAREREEAEREADVEDELTA